MNVLNTIVDGVYWLYRGGYVIGEIQDFVEDVDKMSHQQEPLTMKNILRVISKGTTVALDILILNADQKASKIKKEIHQRVEDKQISDIERLEKTLVVQKTSSAQLQAMALGSSLTTNCANGHLIDVDTILRMGSLVFTSKHAECADILFDGSSKAIFSGTASVAASSAFLYWYQQYGTNAPSVNFSANYQGIPSQYHDNAVFSQFICPITLEPIRYPVTAPNRLAGPDHHFERKAILVWLRNHATNPVNQAPLHVYDLRENVHMRFAIEQEMNRLGILI
jgi:hypothetical protein